MLLECCCGTGCGSCALGRDICTNCVLCIVSFISVEYWEVLESTSLVGLLWGGYQITERPIVLSASTHPFLTYHKAPTCTCSSTWVPTLSPRRLCGSYPTSWQATHIISRSVPWGTPDITAVIDWYLSGIQIVIDANLVPMVITALQVGKLRMQKEAVWAVGNCAKGGTEEQVR